MNTNDNSTATRITAAFEPTTDPTPIKVWLVDDDDGYRTLLAELLAAQQGIDCPRHFNSPDAALSALASKAGPDVLLLDIQMRDRNGLDAIRPIKSLARSTRVLMLTTFYDGDSHARALEEGASGFLLKTSEVQRLVADIRKHRRPGPWLSATAPKQVACSSRRSGASLAHPPPRPRKMVAAASVAKRPPPLTRLRSGRTQLN